MAAETPAEAHARGTEEGRVAAVLAQHGQHLAKINGSMEKVANALEASNEEQHAMRMEMAKIRQQAAADADTRVALAAALEKAEQARREKDKDTAEALRVKSDETWQPYAKALAVLVALVAVAGFIVTVLR